MTKFLLTVIALIVGIIVLPISIAYWSMSQFMELCEEWRCTDD